MNLHYHDDLEKGSPGPGVTRMICMDQKLGAGGITQGMVMMEPGSVVRPHTHLVEESMTLLEGDIRILVGSETVEVRGRRASFVAPANTVHALRNVGQTTAVLCIAYPSVNVTLNFVEGVDF
jgi:quercetin dioxygenase-like cupin family protein